MIAERPIVSVPFPAAVPWSGQTRVLPVPNARWGVELRRGQVLLVVAALVFLLAVPGARPAAAVGVSIDDFDPIQAPNGLLVSQGTITGVAPTGVVDYGDATGVVPVLALTESAPGSGSWSYQLQHTYAANGTYLVTVTATDAGSSTSATMHAQVTGIGGGTGGGGTGTNNPPSVTETFSPAQPVWGQDISFTATITGSPDAHPDWDWEWSFEFGGALTPAGQPTSTVKTITHRYAQPGSKDTSIHAQNLPAGFSTTPIATAHVDVYGRQQYIAIDCGTPTFGLPTTLTATLTDLSPQPSAATLSGRPITFLVNGAAVGTGTTGPLTSANTAVATTTATFTMPPGGSYTCSAALADNRLVALVDPTSGANIPVALVAYTSPPGTGTFPLGTTLSPTGTFIEPGNVTVPQGGNQPAGAPKPLTLLSTPGKVNGEVKNAIDGSKANFEVQAKTGSAVKGHLEYSSPTLSFSAKTFVGLGISTDGNSAVFMGTGQTSGKTPTAVSFLVRIVDNGDHQAGDTFQISFDGGKTFGPLWTGGGNVHIHVAKPGDPDF